MLFETISPLTGYDTSELFERNPNLAPGAHHLGRVLYPGTALDLLRPPTQPYSQWSARPALTVRAVHTGTGALVRLAFATRRIPTRKPGSEKTGKLTWDNKVLQVLMAAKLETLLRTPEVTQVYGPLAFASNFSAAQAAEALLEMSIGFDYYAARRKLTLPWLGVYSGSLSYPIREALRQVHTHGTVGGPGEAIEIPEGLNTLSLSWSHLRFATAHPATRGGWGGVSKAGQGESGCAHIEARLGNEELSQRGYSEGKAYRFHGQPTTGELQLFGHRQKFAFWHVDPDIHIGQWISQDTLQKNLYKEIEQRFPFIIQQRLMSDVKFD